MNRLLFLFLMLLISVGGCSTPVSPDQDVPNTESAAPDFTLPDVSGQPWSLAESLEEGPVVLVFLRGHW